MMHRNQKLSLKSCFCDNHRAFFRSSDDLIGSWEDVQCRGVDSNNLCKKKRLHKVLSIQHAMKAANMKTDAKKVRLCVKCRLCVPLEHFLSRDDGACDGHTTEEQGGCRYARCSTCKRLPSEGTCICQHTCECFACCEYTDNLHRAAMSQGCRYSICWVCFQDESDLGFQCDCKWLCSCKDCVISRKDENQGCSRCECSTCGGRAGDMDPSCDCENTCECGECREDREIDEADLISGTEYEQNEGCRFSACGCNETEEKCKACCRWMCKCRLCRHARNQELQNDKMKYRE
jgi:hypothetical protein